ncbi:MAG TPA: hypothetical protein VGC45_15685 [Gryllotalpicola sp.]
MNRYEVEGIAHDATLGRDILIVGMSHSWRETLDELAQALGTALATITRDNGNMRITTKTGGSIKFASGTPTSMRGRSADIVYIGDLVHLGDEALRVIAARTAGEIIGS